MTTIFASGTNDKASGIVHKKLNNANIERRRNQGEMKTEIEVGEIPKTASATYHLLPCNSSYICISCHFNNE